MAWLLVSFSTGWLKSRVCSKKNLLVVSRVWSRNLLRPTEPCFANHKTAMQLSRNVVEASNNQQNAMAYSLQCTRSADANNETGVQNA